MNHVYFLIGCIIFANAIDLFNLFYQSKSYLVDSQKEEDSIIPSVLGVGIFLVGEFAWFIIQMFTIILNQFNLS